jgi:hypothetical protein
MAIRPTCESVGSRDTAEIVEKLEETEERSSRKRRGGWEWGWIPGCVIALVERTFGGLKKQLARLGARTRAAAAESRRRRRRSSGRKDPPRRDLRGGRLTERDGGGGERDMSRRGTRDRNGRVESYIQEIWQRSSGTAASSTVEREKENDGEEIGFLRRASERGERITRHRHLLYDAYSELHSRSQCRGAIIAVTRGD